MDWADYDSSAPRVFTVIRRVGRQPCSPLNESAIPRWGCCHSNGAIRCDTGWFQFLEETPIR